ncbi:hypothetical protein C0Q70_20204 [Pomacea canaliculata]|uniref:Protein disulfide-isomerase n=2 Tax=Pomacea canaliculata TaxID=400727 RepID=A0A2T7NEV5_POMCA|nr:hypothetical protein C0Q70_20204 [Pomacea canaliculata]
MRALIVVSCVFLAVSASDVLEFTDSNFERKVNEHDLVLVEFYAPWCGHCKKLAPEYEKAATKLKNSDPPVSLAKVDCTAETSTCSKFGVSGYPTLKVFRGGEVSKDYDGPRESDGIVKYMQKLSGPSSKEIGEVSEVEAFIARDGGSVIGFFEKADSNIAKAFQKVADSVEDLRFAHTTSESVLENFKYKDNIVLFRPKVMENKFEETRVVYSGDGTTGNIKKFLEEESFGLCAQRDANNAGKFKKPTFIAFYEVDYVKNPKGTNYWRNRIMKVAKKLRDEGLKAYFAISNKDEMRQELEECGVAQKSGDKPVVCAYDEKGRKFNLQEEFTLESFEEFVRNALDGKLEPYLKSEPIPESNDEPVKVVVAKNFDEIVNNDDKDVLIEFYAPWCGHCKNLAPKYDELAEKLIDESEITIAKMDATANDVPSPYEVRGFPTIYFAPKGSKSSPKKYEGSREVDDFIKYLAREATNELQGWDRNGKKKGGKKKKATGEL